MTMHPGNVNRSSRPAALRRAPTLAAAIALACAASAAGAQTGPGHLEDASVVPRGLFRVRAATVWSRYESRFTSAGHEALGAPFTSAALGSAQLAPLRGVDSLASLAAGQPFTLSLGQSRLDARGRHEIVPIGVEYGLTDRITLGVVVPIVRKRIAVQLRLDSAGATMGPNLHRTSSAAAGINTLLQAQFAAAAAQLQTRLDACQNSGAAGCADLLARQGEALALMAASQGFASAVGSLYGSASATGMAFVPVAGSAAQAEIALRVADFNARYRDLLDSTSDLLTAIPVPAGGPAGTSELQRYLTSELGGDSLATEERIGFGDVELGVKVLVLDVRPATGSLAARATLSAVYRFGTSSQQSPSPLMDFRLGDGRDMLEARGALDLAARRVGLLALGEFTTAFGDALTGGFIPPGLLAAPRPDSRWLSVHLAPRVQLTSLFALHGAWSLRSGDESGAETLAGGGVSFTTMPRYLASGGPLPMEMRYTHLESLSGPVGSPKVSRDQIELRIYVGRRR